MRALFSKPVGLMLAAVIISVAALVFQNENTQGINWTFPYLSGAANLDGSFTWRISPAEYDKVAAMTDAEHRSYRYKATAETVPNTVNEYGYVLVVWAARNLFWWLGDMQAVVLFQLVTHIACCLLILGGALDTPLQRGLFLVLYAANPLVLYFVTYPMYYFWTALPGLLLAMTWLRPERAVRWLPLYAALLLFALLVRPTVLFLSLLVLVTAFVRCRPEQRRAVVYVSCVFVATFVLMEKSQGLQRSPFHTIYLGIGAYENPYGITAPHDDEGYAYFNRQTGITISTNAISGNWREPEVMRLYDRTLRQRYLEILRQSPSLLARNALLNVIQSYGPGYDDDRRWSRPITVSIGVAVILLLALTGQWIWALGVFAYVASFAFYFPPIPAYLFGAYILTALGATFAIERLILQWLSIRGRMPAPSETALRPEHA